MFKIISKIFFAILFNLLCIITLFSMGIFLQNGISIAGWIFIGLNILLVIYGNRAIWVKTSIKDSIVAFGMVLFWVFVILLSLPPD